jgi:hypothetical protein
MNRPISTSDELNQQIYSEKAVTSTALHSAIQSTFTMSSDTIVNELKPFGFRRSNTYPLTIESKHYHHQDRKMIRKSVSDDQIKTILKSVSSYTSSNNKNNKRSAIHEQSRKKNVSFDPMIDRWHNGSSTIDVVPNTSRWNGQ